VAEPDIEILHELEVGNHNGTWAKVLIRLGGSHLRLGIFHYGYLNYARNLYVFYFVRSVLFPICLWWQIDLDQPILYPPQPPELAYTEDSHV
jgi:hypothetical protein